MTLKTVKAGVLEIAYHEEGLAEGWPCILSHGFPYDVEACRDAAGLLAGQGARVIVPWLRGYGPTRFLSASTPRSGEQAALAFDLLSLLDALGIKQAVLAGYDWGGRASCIVSALWPERVTALVTGNSYNIQNIAKANEPALPYQEAALWYQYYFHSERGRLGLIRNREAIAFTLWKMWSPVWKFDRAVFDRTAVSFQNPDFVDVVIHSYRHRFGLVPGDPAVADIEAILVRQPPIPVPAIAIDGDMDGLFSNTADHASKFTGPYEYRRFTDAGHNLPQEKPDEWAKAVTDARAMAG